MPNRICICGGGQQGLAMSAHLSLKGECVCLWNRSASHISTVIEDRRINVSGVINGVATISAASDKIAEVIADLVMVVTPASAHKDVANVIAPFVHSGMVVVLNPGRTFGAIEFRDALLGLGVDDLPIIAETQTIVYTCRKLDLNSVEIYALKHGVGLSCINGSPEKVISLMPTCLREYFVPVSSVYHTSMSNVGMILHCAPVLMNIGWIESERVDFKYYYDGITESVADFLTEMDCERIAVAAALGCDVDTVKVWLQKTYGAKGANLYECIRNTEAYREIDAPQSLRCRYMLEDIPCGLVPVENAGRALGVPTPCISMIIDLSCRILHVDFRTIGRQFNRKNVLC